MESACFASAHYGGCIMIVVQLGKLGARKNAWIPEDYTEQKRIVIMLLMAASVCVLGRKKFSVENGALRFTARAELELSQLHLTDQRTF